MANAQTREHIRHIVDAIALDPNTEVDEKAKEELYNYLLEIRQSHGNVSTGIAVCLGYYLNK